MYNTNTDIWIAGAIAAVTVDFLVYPFDTLKTRIQAPDYEKRYKDAKTGAIRRDVLFKGVYQGVWSVVLSTIPASGAFFTTYEAVKYTLGETSTTTRAQRSSQSQNETIHKFPILHSLPTPIVHAVASSTAEMVSCLMITPAEVLKQNAQVIEKSGGQQTAAIQVFSRFRHKPWKLWSGYAALVGRNLPFTGLHFPLFEYVRSNVVDWRQQEKQKDKDGNGGELGRIQEWNPVLERAVLTGFSAGLSGMVASIVTTPIDVVKTRVMLAASNGHVSGGEGRDAAPGPDTMKKIGTRGTVDVGKAIWENEGIKGLFKGGLIRAAWTAVSLGLYLSIYEAGRFYLEIRRKDRDGKVQKKEGESVI